MAKSATILDHRNELAVVACTVLTAHYLRQDEKIIFSYIQMAFIQLLRNFFNFVHIAQTSDQIRVFFFSTLAAIAFKHFIALHLFSNNFLLVCYCLFLRARSMLARLHSPEFETAITCCLVLFPL